jgi:hypothetical protein
MSGYLPVLKSVGASVGHDEYDLEPFLELAHASAQMGNRMIQEHLQQPLACRKSTLKPHMRQP